MYTDTDILKMKGCSQTGLVVRVVIIMDSIVRGVRSRVKTLCYMKLSA